VKRCRAAHPTKTIIAGNVVTGEMVEELLLSGADLVKVGIGPGSVCTTRKQTGVGYPQLSAIMECADAAHGLNGHVVSDGGCTCPVRINQQICLLQTKQNLFLILFFLFHFLSFFRVILVKPLVVEPILSWQEVSSRLMMKAVVN
jgi:IMP dehydrogenase/GMP reductase